MSKRIWIVVLLAAVIVLGGCVTPAARKVIAGHADNAVEADRRVQGLPDGADDGPVPAWVKTWMAEDLKAWQAMEAWANRKASTPTTQPAESEGDDG